MKIDETSIKNTPINSAPVFGDQGEAVLEHAKKVLHIEAEAILQLASTLGKSFLQAVEALQACKGRVIVSGIGKSGHIARKIAATFASTGTPSFFVHTAEAFHGDLGMITSDDLVLLISNSGESPEIVNLIPHLKRRGAILIGMTGNQRSSLAQNADISLDISISKEACPLGLAPTASTTVTLALGDALAVCLLDSRGFGRDDFALSHPGGALGRKLLVRVADVMRTGEHVPRVLPSASIQEAVFEISSKGLGMTAIVDTQDKLIGVFTDGDLRRAFDRGGNLKLIPVAEFMNDTPKTVAADSLAVEAVNLIQDKKVSGLFVTDAMGKMSGVLSFHDLLRAGVV